ncbi:MAG TPA: YraN family protein [Spirochaetota bacterium]|nr:YraN family protein [Spirochaetota bacterium]HOL57421.1 YraN family protein [Spirochaetota bacterium]HPP03321.1 YraN family protein [Spirochaetota bacterium]
MNKNKTGKLGEKIAKNYLEKNGIKIIEENYFTKFGEIDLIGIENKTIIFIEVKLRFSNSFGAPYEAVDLKKWEKLQNAASLYLTEHNINDMECRFDVISLLYLNDTKKFNIEWLKNQSFY